MSKVFRGQGVAGKFVETVWALSPSVYRRSTARGLQLLLVRVALFPFVCTLASLFWMGYVEESVVHPAWMADITHALMAAIPACWVASLWWGWRRALHLSKALEVLRGGQAAALPNEFSGLAEHLNVLQASLREKEMAAATYEAAVQRVDVQRRLLQLLAREGLNEVDLEGWADSLRKALETVHPKTLSLWVQDGQEFVWSAGDNAPEQRRRAFAGLAPCWIETNAQGEHHFFVKVEAGYEASADLPPPVLLVVELWLEPGPDRLEEMRERLLGISPLLSISWASWTLYHELFSRMRMHGSVIQSLEDGVLLADRSGLVLSCNRAGSRILGLPVEKIQGQPLEVLLEHSWSRPSPSFEIHIQRPNQSPLDVLVINYLASSRLAVSSGLGITVVLRDITKQRELDNLRSDFTATLSHELRTPLTSMKGYLQTLMHRKARTFDMDKVQSIVSVVNGQADQLQRLIQELLEAAKMRSQDLEIRPRPVDIGALLRECLEDYSNPKVAQSAVCSEECWALCDPERIHSVLEHLLSNAQKYSLPGGAVELGCRRAGAQVAVWVRDEGVGIPLDQQSKIFEMYHRLDTGNQRTHYGVGVGLYIARKVVEGHGGTIAVDSAPGCGATFSFTLPLCPAEPEGSVREGQLEVRDGGEKEA
ncbi:MAG: PAS domain-containing protein [Candidatus Eremiobacteraeota bacterium]|nr:PAS domain-containing protein [Candidatus Eremiobacteraeota bacterium]MCW5866292.1 PAS domain-containing protein [Candidatus Eremiobacteraeota bacterium]